MSNSVNNNADNQAAGNKGVFHFQDAKHIMAAYLNMAGDHLMRTVDYVLGRVNLTRNDVVSKSTDKPEAVLNGLKKRLKKNQGVPSLGAEGEARLRELLFTHFPMLEMLADMDTVKDNKAETVDKDNNKGGNTNQRRSGIVPLYQRIENASLEKAIERLANIAKVLDNLRNFYTHYWHFDTPREQLAFYLAQIEVCQYLETIMKQGRRLVKRGKALTKEEQNFITTARWGKVGRKYLEKEDFYFRITQNLAAIPNAKNTLGEQYNATVDWMMQGSDDAKCELDWNHLFTDKVFFSNVAEPFLKSDARQKVIATRLTDNVATLLGCILQLGNDFKPQKVKYANLRREYLSDFSSSSIVQRQRTTIQKNAKHRMP